MVRRTRPLSRIETCTRSPFPNLSPPPSPNAVKPSGQPTGQPSRQPSRQPTTSPTTVLSETTDGDTLCDYWSTLTTTNKAKLTNWCSAKSGTGSYVNGPCTGTGGTWLGVTCAAAPGGYYRVSMLSLVGKALGGSLPTSIGNLGAVTSLRLTSNSLVGGIPSSLGGLTRLALLDLSANAFVGKVPSSLGGLTSLRALNFASNLVTGPIPSSFCSLPSSIIINAYSNPGLTCYPSCLSTFSSLGLDASLSAVCPSETTDGDVLCDYWSTLIVTNQTKLTNWCGAKSGTGSYVNGPCTGTAGAWAGVTCAVVGDASRVTSLQMSSAAPLRGLGSLPTRCRPANHFRPLCLGSYKLVKLD